METFTLDKAIKVFYVTAKSFPDGILEAHQKLHALIPPSKERKYFGISSPGKDGVIVYKAAAEEMTRGEAEKYGCEAFVIKKGEYVSETVKDFMNDFQSVGTTFKKLLAEPQIDPQGYCLEWYLNEKDVRCMVGLQ